MRNCERWLSLCARSKHNRLAGRKLPEVYCAFVLELNITSEKVSYCSFICKVQFVATYRLIITIMSHSDSFFVGMSSDDLHCESCQQSIVLLLVVSVE